MSIEQTDVIDIISTDRILGDVVLTISDHLDWSDSTTHQLLLQRKLNRYLAFIESGEILEKYPQAKNRSVVLKIVFKFAPDEGGCAFIVRAKEVVQSAGFNLQDELFRGENSN